MYYIESEICIGGRFLEGCFYCYYQQIISAVPKEFLIAYNLIQRAPETQNIQHCNNECHPKLKQKNMRYGSVFRIKDFVSHQYTQ